MGYFHRAVLGHPHSRKLSAYRLFSFESHSPAFFPRTSAEYRTMEQPTGKITSFTPLGMISTAERGPGAAQYVRAIIGIPNKIPTRNPVTMCATTPPHWRCPSQPIAAPRHAYSIPLSKEIANNKEEPMAAGPAIFKA